MIDLLAEPTPNLRQALRTARRKTYAVLDGTLVPIDRLPGAGDRLHYSGKHRRHGVNAQLLTDPHGEQIWAPPALPGSVHDLTAARQHGIIDGPTFWATADYADKGHQGAGGAIDTPYKRAKSRKPEKRKKPYNQYHAKVRAVGERSAATLKQRHILRKARCSPSRMTAVVQAILALEHQGR